MTAPTELRGFVFLVERVMPGLRSSDVAALQHVLVEACRRVTADGEPVTYLRSTFIPEQGRWMAVFRAPTAELVVRVNEMAQVPGLRIDAAMEITHTGD